MHSILRKRSHVLLQLFHLENCFQIHTLAYKNVFKVEKQAELRSLIVWNNDPVLFPVFNFNFLSLIHLYEQKHLFHNIGEISQIHFLLLIAWVDAQTQVKALRIHLVQLVHWLRLNWGHVKLILMGFVYQDLAVVFWVCTLECFEVIIRWTDIACDWSGVNDWSRGFLFHFFFGSGNLIIKFVVTKINLSHLDFHWLL